jgi:hypothetical protein
MKGSPPDSPMRWSARPDPTGVTDASGDIPGADPSSSSVEYPSSSPSPGNRLYAAIGDEPTEGPVTCSREDWNIVAEVIVLITGDPMSGDWQQGDDLDITGVLRPPE